MALVDPSIAMSYRAPEFKAPNQLAQYAQMQQILGGQQEQQLNALKMQEYERARTEDEGLRNYLAQTDLANPQTRIGALKYGKRGAEFGKALSEQEKDVAATAASKFELKAKQATFLDQAKRNLSSNPSDDNVRSWGQDAVINGIYTPEQAERTVQELLKIPPENRAQIFAMAGATANELRPQVVGPGASLVTGNKAVFTAPEKTPVVAPTNLAKLQTELAALPPGDPRRAQYEAAILKETQFAPQAVTKITNVQEKAEAGAYGKMLVDQYGDLSKAANLAVKTLPSIESNLSILNKGFDTGFGTEAKAAGAKILGALGVPNAEKYATDTQTFQSNALQGVLQKQLEQKGPQTESDAQRIQQIGAQLGKTKGANEFILLTAKEQLQRDIDQRNFYADWRKKTNSFEGAESAWFAGEGGKSLFDRPALKKFAVSGGAAAQIPTTAAPARAPVAPATTAITNPKFPGFSIGKP